MKLFKILFVAITLIVISPLLILYAIGMVIAFSMNGAPVKRPEAREISKTTDCPINYN